MTENIPFFSVITAVYNGAKYLPDLIESLQQQSFTDYEHIIIDDGSTDDGATVAVLEHYANADSRIRWWSRENKGAYPTQQEGLEATHGQFLLVINADDRLYNAEALAIIYTYLTNHPDCEMVYGKTKRIDENNTELPQLDIHWQPSGWLLRQVCYIQHCSLFVSRHLVFDKNIWLNLEYQYSADWDWIIRLFQASDKVGRVPQPIGAFRLHYQQRSRSGLEGLSNEAMRICEIYGGSYRLHVVLTKLNNYRAMVLIALHTLRTQGIKAFTIRISGWLRKRLAR